MLKEMGSITPMTFLQLKAPIGQKETPLPDTTELLGEFAFAKVKMGWSDEGLFVLVTFAHPITEKDSVELFIDTRDVKSKTITRFCHHFVCKKEGGEEITRFRGDETHPICEPFPVEVEKKTMRIFLPASILHGYTPLELPRLGFNYRLMNRGTKMHFSASTKLYTIEQNPALWATLELR